MEALDAGRAENGDGRKQFRRSGRRRKWWGFASVAVAGQCAGTFGGDLYLEERLHGELQPQQLRIFVRRPPQLFGREYGVRSGFNFLPGIGPSTSFLKC